MKFLIVGLGSMGKRRVRNLKRLGFDTIVGYDPRPDRRAEAEQKYAIATLGDWPSAENSGATAWIVSTPPDTHLDYGFKALDRGVSFFTEANVTDARAPEMIRRLSATKLVGAPSCTLRYYPGPKKIKELIGTGQIGRPLAFTYQSGQYLPDWHPWESYKDFYVGKRDTGACREIVPFELAWLTDVFGAVEGIDCQKDKVSDLDVDIDDIYQLLLRFRSGLLGHLMVDVITQPAVRFLRVVGAAGTAEWDHLANSLRIWTVTSRAWQSIPLESGVAEKGYINAEEPYVAEMADFVAAVRGERPWPYTYEDDEAVLDLLRRAEASAQSGIRQ